jgi:two-component system response regulator YesN
VIKAVLFDDEYIVVEGLAQMVDWTGLGIELAGTAEDGLSAWSMFRSIRPDLVLTDIRMPGMDGLKLIEEILKEDPEVCCVVFSGFNEFEYVKRAIEIGVAGYIEKPISEDKIEQTLRKVLGQIHKQRAMKEMSLKLELNQQELLKKATWDLLLFGGEALNEWVELYGETEAIRGIAVLVSGRQIDLPVSDDYRAIAMTNGQEHVTVLIQYADGIVQELAGSISHLHFPIGLGNTYSDLARASMSYREAQQAFKTAAFLEMERLVHCHELDRMLSVSIDQFHEREEAFLVSLQSGNRALLEQEVDRFIAWLREARISSDMTERLMLKLIYESLEVAERTGVRDNLGFSKPYLPHVEIQEMADKGKLTQWFRQQIDMIIRAIPPLIGQTVHHEAVEKARQYIERNISRDLSLQEVADHVGMNPTYLSVLFKEIMGESYIKYVTRSRMELAKSLLRKGYKVQEVSEKVGYMTPRHFFDVFKKYTGMSPKQFKDS